jgi:hypothetical protein
MGARLGAFGGMMRFLNREWTRMDANFEGGVKGVLFRWVGDLRGWRRRWTVRSLLLRVGGKIGGLWGG